ncbi:MAG: hypothetical protein GX603_04675 [Chloroflexi bacterium]|nr:hypothetical protein [Chloroflexota bacterium]
MNKHFYRAFFALTLILLSACQAQPIETATATALPTQTSTASPTATAVPSKTPEPSATPAPTAMLVTPTPPYSYPESHYITGISGHMQTYELGCEASAAVDWAAFFGVSIFESVFQYSLPLSDNPDLGYVGEVTTDAWGQIPPYAYGVHAAPIADALVAFDLPARAVTGYTIEEVKRDLANNKPIIAWVIGNMEYSEPVEYLDAQGRTALVAPYEHVVILTGYNQTHLRYMNNGKFFDTPIEVFLTSWGVLGNMAVIYE